MATKPVEAVDDAQNLSTFVVPPYKHDSESILKTPPYNMDGRERGAGASESAGQLDGDVPTPMYPHSPPLEMPQSPESQRRIRPEGRTSEKKGTSHIETQEEIQRLIDDKQKLIAEKEELQHDLDRAKETIEKARGDKDQLMEALQQKDEEIRHLAEMIEEKDKLIESLKRQTELELWHQERQPSEPSSTSHDHDISKLPLSMMSIQVSDSDGRPSKSLVIGTFGIPSDYEKKLEDHTFVGQKIHPNQPLGSGAFGTVWELRLDDGKKAAGKEFRTYDAPVSRETQVIKFCRELHFLVGLKHEHIVSYRGMCAVPGSTSFLPMLVMELMKTNLHDYLLDGSRRPSPRTKVSILLGISKGLDYLHEKGVLHRDLTAKNILLSSDTVTTAPVAKIGDFGNSRIIDFASQCDGMTPNPGTLFYMPPEAGSGKYSLSLDIFSFGHLALFTITQNFLRSLLTSTFKVGDNLKGRSEVNRRQESFDIMHIQLAMGTDHILVSLVKKCLDNVADKRPSAKELSCKLRLNDSELWTDPQCHEEPRRLYEDVDIN